MCEVCGPPNDDASGRVHSLSDFSTQLIDAFMASDGAHKAVVFVDTANDAFYVKSVEYDQARKCIKIMLHSPYVDIACGAMALGIEEVNSS